MPRYEYKLVPAPEKATKHKGLKGAANFAATLTDLMNDLGAEGWAYLRADILPEEVRTGLTSRSTTYRNLLVFQRELPDETPPPRARRKPVVAPPEDDPDDEDDPGDPALANLFIVPDEDRDDRDDRKP
jgi:hypothetical protein